MGGLYGITMAEIPSRCVTLTSTTVEAWDGNHDEISTMMKYQNLDLARP